MTWTGSIRQDQIDRAGEVKIATSTRELLELFDKSTADARKAIAGASDEHLMKPWTLAMGGKEMFTQPRWLALRTYVLNHNIHHRAQLGVYLRLNGISVPAIYNDSADEKGGMFRDDRGRVAGAGEHA